LFYFVKEESGLSGRTNTIDPAPKTLWNFINSLPLTEMVVALLATTLVAALSSFLAISRQPAVYQSRTTLMIGRFIEDPNPSGNEFTLTLQLAEIYADMGNREPLKNATMEALGLHGCRNTSSGYCREPS
jgi:hypothetical protein